MAGDIAFGMMLIISSLQRAAERFGTLRESAARIEQDVKGVRSCANKTRASAKRGRPPGCKAWGVVVCAARAEAERA
jgi:hypothetical protein